MQDIYPCPNTFYRTLSIQLDGISPLIVYHNTFHNVPIVIFPVINLRLTRMALQMLKKVHGVFINPEIHFQIRGLSPISKKRIYPPPPVGRLIAMIM